jgi:tetratricopeptide (TPR) repeat protein
MEVIGHRGEWAVCLVPIGLALVAAAARKFCAIASSAMLFSLVALGPVLGLVPFSYQYYSTVSDRYAYLALIGPAIIVSEIVSRFVFSPAKSRALFAACIALLLISIRLTTSECWAWANTAALIRHTLVQNSGSRLMQMIALLDLGDADYNAHRPAQALSKYEQLIVNRPDYAPAHYNAGNALLQMGLTDRAIGEFQTAIRLDPTDALYYMNYGNALSDKGENMAALSNYDRAITLNSTLRKVHFNKGSVLMKIGALDAALREFDSEIVNDEYVSAYVNKGIVLIELNRPAEAAGALQSAIAIGPPTSSWFTNLAVAQIALGRKSDARASVVHALALSPGDETASSILQMLDHGGKR